MKPKKKKKYINQISVFPLSHEYRNALWISLDFLCAILDDNQFSSDLDVANSLSLQLLRLQNTPDPVDLQLMPKEVAAARLALSYAVKFLNGSPDIVLDPSPVFCRLRSELTEYSPCIRNLDQVFSQCLSDLLISSKTPRQ